MTETQYFLKKVATGKDIPIRPEMSIGRSDDSALRLVEGQPSRHHAQITADQSSVFVEDLGSTNGTFVNGRRLDAKSKVKLSAGDRVRFDIEEFVFVAPGPAAAGEGDKTLFRPPDPEKTMYRPPPPEPKTAEAAQRTIIEARPPASGAAAAVAAADGAAPADAPPAAAQKPAQAEKPAAAAKTEPPASPKKGGDAQSQALPGSFADPKGNATVWVRPDRKQGQAAPSTPVPAHTPGDAPYFWIETGSRAGKKIELKAGSDANTTWRVGSSESSNVRFEDAGVSGKHATLRHDKSTWLLIDDLSVNGTFVNDKKVLKGYLADGDRVRFGPVECRFYLPPPGAADRAGGGASWRKYGIIAAFAFALTLAMLWLAYRFMK